MWKCWRGCAEYGYFICDYYYFKLIDNIVFKDLRVFILGIGMIWMGLGLANYSVRGLADSGAKSITA